jgi:hypothetical protein
VRNAVRLRVARTDGGVHRLRRTPPRVLPSAPEYAGAWARPSRGRDAFAPHDTSRQPNTHNTESREVCYPWHPWFGRAVAVYEVLVKHGHSVSRCGLEEERNRRSVEIPTWMFEPTACCRLRLMAVPTVGCEARELQALLRTVRPDSGGVLQAQRRSLLTAGRADASVREPTTTLATHTLSSPTPASVVSDVVTRDPIKDDQVAGAAASGARRPSSRLRSGTGGA